MSENSDIRLRGTTTVELEDTQDGTIHPLVGGKRSLLDSIQRELSGVTTDPQAKKIFSLAMMNVLCTIVLLIWCNSTNSMALTAYAYLTIFDIMCLLTCLVSIWVQQQKPSPIFSFGYERFEVLAVFASTILAQFGSFFILKESIERMLFQPEIHTGRLLVGTSLAFSFHILVTYTMDNRAFNHVIVASSSSWLQEHVSDISESICNVVPGVSKLLLPRINPFALIAFAGAMALVFVYLLIDIRNYYSADTWAAVWIAMMTCGTMFPMSVYSGKILLQTTPSHIIGQLDKSIREASTLDGVLEFRNEHFWNLTFGTMAGSVHVRVRRDADEQLVLAHVYNRLANIVPILTVQIFKDDWSRPSTIHLLNSLSGSFGPSSPTGSTPKAASAISSSLYSNQTMDGSHYNSLERSPSPYSSIPSRTDPAVVANLGASLPGNIPALRLAANATANALNQQILSQGQWPGNNRLSSPPQNLIDPRTSSDGQRSNPGVVSLGNLGSGYLGSGLSMGSTGGYRPQQTLTVGNIYPGADSVLDQQSTHRHENTSSVIHLPQDIREKEK